MDFKQKIRKLRTDRGLTCAQVAKACDVSEVTMWQWENGFYKPKYEKLLKLSQLFNVSLDYLIKDDEESSTATTESTSINESNNNNDFLIAMDALSYNLSEADKRTLLNIASSLIDAQKSKK